MGSVGIPLTASLMLTFALSLPHAIYWANLENITASWVVFNFLRLKHRLLILFLNTKTWYRAWTVNEEREWTESVFKILALRRADDRVDMVTRNVAQADHCCGGLPLSASSSMASSSSDWVIIYTSCNPLLRRDRGFPSLGREKCWRSRWLELNWESVIYRRGAMSDEQLWRNTS